MLQLSVFQYRLKTTIRNCLKMIANRKVTTTTCVICNWRFGETETSLQQVLLIPQPIIPKQYDKIKSKLYLCYSQQSFAVCSSLIYMLILHTGMRTQLILRERKKDVIYSQDSEKHLICQRDDSPSPSVLKFVIKYFLFS